MEQPLYLSASDEELVSRTLSDKAYFGELVERYEARLARYIERLGVNNLDDRLDVLQDIFLKTYRNLNSFDPDMRFSSWIYRIAHNEAISWYRKRHVRPEGHLVAENEEVLSFLRSDTETAEMTFDKVINVEEVNRALFQIDKKYRDVIILRYFEHKEYEEISDILKIPLGSVGTWLHRGKKQLLRVLNKQKIRI